MKKWILLSQWITVLAADLSDRPHFLPLAKLVLFRDTVLAFLLPCGHIANSLQGQNLFSFRIWSVLLALLVLDKAAVGRLLLKDVWFSVRMDGSQCALSRMVAAAGPAAGKWALSSFGLRSLGEKQKQFFISLCYSCFMFWNIGYKLCAWVFDPTCQIYNFSWLQLNLSQDVWGYILFQPMQNGNFDAIWSVRYVNAKHINLNFV